MYFKLLFVFLFLSLPAYAAEPLVPNPLLTPGAINIEATTSMICVRGYTSGNDSHGNPVRNVTDAIKKQIFQDYKIDPKSDQFEIDHLISLELGGSNDTKNLWPQSYTTKPINARTKDGLENRLHALVCAGKLSLSDAQTQISTDWVTAYIKYVGQRPK